MNRASMTNLAKTMAVVFICLSIDGCGDEDNPARNQDNGTAPTITAVSPANGTSNVPRSSTIGIRFNVPMDTNSVMGAFHLAGGSDVGLWMDSIGHHMGTGGMGMTNMDHMMQWMDSIQYNGQWHWNTNRDSCWFDPDSSLMPDTDHMIYLYGNMRSHDGMMMDIDTMQYGGPMYHFRTAP